MRTCYLCGPMRGHPNFNFPVFNKAAKMLRDDKWVVISPAELDREALEPWTKLDQPDYANDTYTLSPEENRRLIRRDVNAILSLIPANGDRLLMLPGWRKSVGGFGEGGVARWAMVPIVQFSFSTENRKAFNYNPNGFFLSEVPEASWGAKAL